MSIKGLFPVSANFTTDLHSIGQFIQDGSRTLFETVLWVENARREIAVPDDPGNVDGLDFAAGRAPSWPMWTAARRTW